MPEALNTAARGVGTARPEIVAGDVAAGREHEGWTNFRSWSGYQKAMATAAILVVAVPAVVLFPGTHAHALTAGLHRGFGTTQLLLLAGIAVLAGAAKGICGFGDALIITPLAALLVSPHVAVVVLAVPPLMLNLFQIGETGIGWSYIREQWALITAALVGSAIGVFALSKLPKTPALPILIAVILLAYIAWQLLRRAVPAPRAAHPAALGAVGAVEGFLLATVNMGPLLPAYLHSFERNARRYIGGMSMVFALVFAERILQMVGDGLMTPYRYWLGAVIALVTLVGLVGGTMVRRWKRFNAKVFSAVIMVMLGATAITMLVKALPKVI